MLKKPSNPFQKQTKYRIFGINYMQPQTNIRPQLLWEYNLETFNRKKSFKIVIERVIQGGTLEDWREIMAF